MPSLTTTTYLFPPIELPHNFSQTLGTVAHPDRSTPNMRLANHKKLRRTLIDIPFIYEREKNPHPTRKIYPPRKGKERERKDRWALENVDGNAIIGHSGGPKGAPISHRGRFFLAQGSKAKCRSVKGGLPVGHLERTDCTYGKYRPPLGRGTAGATSSAPRAYSRVAGMHGARLFVSGSLFLFPMCSPRVPNALGGGKKVSGTWGAFSFVVRTDDKCTDGWTGGWMNGV